MNTFAQNDVANGTYMKILEKWGIQEGAITEPKINPES